MPRSHCSVSFRMARRMWFTVVSFMFVNILVHGKLENDTEIELSGQDLEDSSEHIGPAVTQVIRHPYAASLLKNDSYVCSAVVLNTYWLITASRCFDGDIISSYVTHKNLGNFTIRVGSSYNNKGGSLYKVKMLINNFDLKISTIKLETPMVFGSRVEAVRLPGADEEAALGYLASLIAWTPTSHIRVVNVPVIEDSICDDSTKLLPGHFICVGGVQDPNKHFCRQDNGGAVIQNETLIAITSFLHTCAVYTKTHAFPKVSSFARWIDSVIWDEESRPTTTEPTTTDIAKSPNVTDSTPSQTPYFADPSKFLLTLPFDPVNVPLQPAEDNSVLPRMSLYEAYLQNIAKAKTSTTLDPTVEDEKRMWFKKFGHMMKAPTVFSPKKYQQYDYSNV